MKIFEDLALAAERAIDKEADQLTEDERVAIAWIAGCSIDLEFDGNVCKIKTVHRVAICKSAGGWIVGERASRSISS